MTDDYEQISFKNLFFFSGIVVMTTAVVLLVYGWINGFDYMGQSLKSASQVMVAGFTQPTTPPTYAPAQQAMTSPPQNSISGYQPAALAAPTAPSQLPGPAGQSTGQYVCPLHGAVGIPLFSANSVAQCPLCGQVMQFNCLTTGNAGNTGNTLAAWNTPGGGGGGGGG